MVQPNNVLYTLRASNILKMILESKFTPEDSCRPSARLEELGVSVSAPYSETVGDVSTDKDSLLDQTIIRFP